MDFNKSVEIYLNECKCPDNGLCGGAHPSMKTKVCPKCGKPLDKCVCKKASVGTTPMKPMEAINILVKEYGVPKAKAIEAVLKSFKDKSKVSAMAKYLVENVIDESVEDEKANLNAAKIAAKAAKAKAYNQYKLEKNKIAQERTMEKLRNKAERYNNKAEDFSKNGNKAVIRDKIKNTIEGILMAVAVGGAGLAYAKREEIADQIRNRITPVENKIRSSSQEGKNVLTNFSNDFNY